MANVILYSGMKVIKNVLDYLKDELGNSIKDRISDNFENGICKNELNEFIFTVSSNLLNVNTGVAYSAITASSTEYNERIVIDNSSVFYVATNTISTTYDGISNVLTPQSTGCANIPLTTSSPNYVWIRYLKTIDPTIFTLHKITNQKQFYEGSDGYEIRVTSTTTPPPNVSGNGWIYLGNADLTSGIVIDYTGRSYFKLKEYRAKISTPKFDLSNRTQTYTLSMTGFLDDHVKCISNTAVSGVTATLLVSPNNPHGTTIYDCGYSDDFKVTTHNQVQHTSGVIKDLSSILPEAALCPVEINGTGGGDDAIGITKLGTNEYVVVDGNIIPSTTILGTDSGTGLWSVDLGALGAGGYYVYLDKATTQLKTVISTDLIFKGYPTSGYDYTKLVLCLFTIASVGPVVVSNIEDKRLFGTISPRDIQVDYPPVATIIMNAATIVPSKWLLCSGNTIGNTGSGATYSGPQYKKLYDAIGNTFGGSSPNWFGGVAVTLPDLVNKFVRGAGTTALGVTAGDNDHTHTVTGSADDVAGTKHIHNLYYDASGTDFGTASDANNNWVGRVKTGMGSSYPDSLAWSNSGGDRMDKSYNYTISGEGGHTHSLTASANNQANVPVHIGLNYIIKY